MAKSWLTRNSDKLIWPAVITAGLGIVGNVLSPLISSWFQNRSSDIVVRQSYNTVEPKTAVPNQVGSLLLDYQPEAQLPRSLYLIEVSNEGNAPEEDLRLQVGFPAGITVAYGEEPDFRVYRPEEVTLNENRFFMSLRQFPQMAKAPVSFELGKDLQALCQVKIKAAGKEKEGRVEPLKGVQCN